MRQRFAWFIAAVALLVCGLLAPPGGANAQATVEPFAIPFQEGPIPVDDTCAGAGVVGILTGTGTITGQVVSTPAGPAIHQVRIEFQYRVAFPDGSYLLASQRERITLVEEAGDVRTFGGTLLARGTLHDATGAVIGHEAFHHRLRLTIAGGAPRAAFDVGFLTCR